MHVHPPEGPIRSIGQFLIHIFTITVGLLIALGLDGLAQRYHEYKVIDEARRNLQAELTETKSRLIVNLAAHHDTVRTLEKQIDFAKALKRDRRTAPPTESLTTTFVALPTTNWDTAMATGAVALMPYREVRLYSAAYQGERTFMAMEDEAKLSAFALSAFDGDYAQMSDAEVEAGLRQLRISLAYEKSMEQTGVVLLERIETALNASHR